MKLEYVCKKCEEGGEYYDGVPYLRLTVGDKSSECFLVGFMYDHVLTEIVDLVNGLAEKLDDSRI